MAAGSAHFDKEVYTNGYYNKNKYLSNESKKQFKKKCTEYYALEAEINKKLGEIYGKR